MSEVKHVTPVSGQYAVVKGHYRWSLIAVRSVTEKQFKGLDDYFGHQRLRTFAIRDCRYCGDEESARILLDRLTSSDAQCDNEKRKAHERREKRNEALIAKAGGRS